ncbi:hypothetical protein D3C80_1274960 [compost metagenome]
MAPGLAARRIDAVLELLAQVVETGHHGEVAAAVVVQQLAGELAVAFVDLAECSVVGVDARRRRHLQQRTGQQDTGRNQALVVGQVWVHQAVEPDQFRPAVGVAQLTGGYRLEVIAATGLRQAIGRLLPLELAHWAITEVSSCVPLLMFCRWRSSSGSGIGARTGSPRLTAAILDSAPLLSSIGPFCSCIRAKAFRLL